MTTERHDIDKFEQRVADLLAAEGDAAQRDAAPPSAARVWFRAEMRARQDAARAADRPLTFMHALAIACSAGLFLGAGGAAIGWLLGPADWLTAAGRALVDAAPAVATDLTRAWVLVPMTALIVLGSVALFVIFADE
ncbi:MAG TPA: hypothetical protein VGL62_16425 [Vicinamibacterales bacterium]|jgi:hypothetical protein